MSVSDCIREGDFILHRDCHAICFAERCSHCSAVLTTDVVQAIGRKFHSGCLSCAQCGKSDGLPESYSAVHGMPYCERCFVMIHDSFPKCPACNVPVLPSTDQAAFLFRGRKYFVHCPRCLKCDFCGCELPIAGACVAQGRLCCGECFKESRSHFCAVCGELVIGAASARFETRWFHPEHFRCTVCDAALATNTAVYEGGALRCRQCAAEARENCKACGKVVQSDGVEVCGSKWHRPCFRCRICMSMLAVKPFVNVEMEPTCLDCYRRLKAEGRIDKRGRVKT
jgi:hypothetical protein